MPQDINNKERNSMKKQDLKALMEVKDLSFTYPEAPEATLKKNNLKIYEHKITAMIGPSGCGKSTLLRAMNRIHDLYPGCHYEGKIDLFNPETDQMENLLDLRKEDELIGLRQRVGMIFQKPTPFPMSIYDNVAYGLRLSGMKNKGDLDGRIEKALKDAAIWKEVKDRLKDSATGLSGGQQQRLCIARSVALKPEILLFDEPTSALDPIATAAIEELISELKKDITVVIVTHNMQQASRLSDYTTFMYLGDIIEFDKTKNIFLNPSQKLTEDYITGRFG